MVLSALSEDVLDGSGAKKKFRPLSNACTESDGFWMLRDHGFRMDAARKLRVVRLTDLGCGRARGARRWAVIAKSVTRCRLRGDLLTGGCRWQKADGGCGFGLLRREEKNRKWCKHHAHEREDLKK